MEKMKASQLLTELRHVTEKSLENQERAVNEHLQEIVNYDSVPDYKTIFEIINENNMFLTSAYTKAIIAFLSKHGFIDYDLNK